MTNLDRCLNVWDLRAAAQRRLPKGVFEFVDRATEDHIAVANNRSAFERIKLRHRALVDVSKRSVATTLFGKPASLPMAIAPTGAAGLCWHEGELELARAAAKAQIPLTLSTASMTPMEKIAAVGGRLWFQLYVWKRRDLSHQLIERAHRNGFEALIVTVDSPVSANREYNTHNGFGLPFNPTLRFTARHDAPSRLDHGRADEILHLRPVPAPRELSRRIPEIDPQRRRLARRDAGGFAGVGGHREVPRHLAGRADAEGRQPPGRCDQGTELRRRRHRGVEPWRAEHGQRGGHARRAAGDRRGGGRQA